MTNFGFTVSDTVLLTGAGFTHNFGGFLANGMWAEIHNNFLRHYSGPDNSRIIKEIKNNFNYEDIYQSIGDSNEYTPEAIKAFMMAGLNAYQTLDNIIRDYDYGNKVYSNKADISHLAIAKFIQLIGNKKRHGFFFTLNQDIFIERYVMSSSPSSNLPANHLVCPGVGMCNYSRFHNKGGTKELESADLVKVLKDKELDEAKMDFRKSPDCLHYIKLHGSYDWRDEKNQTKMIIGTNKPGQIEKEPLLSWYFQLFKEVLILGNRRLLIIGYGFGDPHINDVIIDAIKRHNLKIYVISPDDPKDFREKVDKIDSNFYSAMNGYYQCTLKEIFPAGGNSPRYENMKREFFYL